MIICYIEATVESFKSSSMLKFLQAKLIHYLILIFTFSKLV